MILNSFYGVNCWLWVIAGMSHAFAKKNSRNNVVTKTPSKKQIFSSIFSIFIERLDELDPVSKKTVYFYSLYGEKSFSITNSHIVYMSPTLSETITLRQSKCLKLSDRRLSHKFTTQVSNQKKLQSRISKDSRHPNL